MENVEILNSTGNSAADSTIKGGLILFRAVFGDILLSSYVSGSYALSYEVPSSDVDLYLFLKRPMTKKEEELFDDIDDALFEMSFPPLDLIPRDIKDVKKKGIVKFKENFLHVWGEDLSEQIEEPDIEGYIYNSLHGCFQLCRRNREGMETLQIPISPPDPKMPLLGFDEREMKFAGGVLAPCTKEIVVLGGWMASTLVALSSKNIVPTKQECPQMYNEFVGDEWSSFIEGLHRDLRKLWNYEIPQDQFGLEMVREYALGLVEFENHFLKIYHQYLLDGLKFESLVRQRTHLIRLGQLIYRPQKVLSYLSEYTPASEEHKKILEETIETVKSFIP
ncbi:MAG: hypothetical protein HOE90_21680 [Bacteriovoracaceae bacterium]|jgi:hypothetical protein|nr:hypothetical protein [Bacteriovoracaceae bacterium]